MITKIQIAYNLVENRIKRPLTRFEKLIMEIAYWEGHIAVRKTQLHEIREAKRKREKL
jgi:hypothetical protein